jgi:hypothetical protein
MRAVAQLGGLVTVMLLGAACSGSTSDEVPDSGNAGGSSAASGSGGASGSGNAGTGAIGTGGSGNAGTGATGTGGSGNAGTGGTRTDGGAGTSGAGGTAVDAGGVCRGPDPSGCVQTGCPDGLECDRTQGCRPSSCFCDHTGQWGCTADCSGGTCVEPQCVGCPLERPAWDTSCVGYPVDKLCTYAQQTDRCEFFTGGTSSGRNYIWCRARNGSQFWTR